MSRTAPDSRRDWRAAVAIGAFALVAAVVSLTVQVPRTPIEADLVVDALNLQLAAAETLWTDKPLALTSVNVSGHASAELDMAPFAVAGEDVTAEGADLALTQLALPESSSLSLENGQSGMAIYVRHAIAEGAIAVRVGSITAADRRRRVTAARTRPPTLVTFRGPVSATAARPLRIGLSGAPSWTLELRPGAFDFRSERPEGSSRFVSTVRGGNISIPETRKAVTIRSRDSVVIALAEPARQFTVRDSAGLLLVSIRGSASTVMAGPTGKLDDLRPSWAEYLYQAERIKLLWAVVTLVWGFAWSIRKAMAK